MAGGGRGRVTLLADLGEGSFATTDWRERMAFLAGRRLPAGTILAPGARRQCKQTPARLDPAPRRSPVAASAGAGAAEDAADAAAAAALGLSAAGLWLAGRLADNFRRPPAPPAKVAELRPPRAHPSADRSFTLERANGVEWMEASERAKVEVCLR